MAMQPILGRILEFVFGPPFDGLWTGDYLPNTTESSIVVVVIVSYLNLCGSGTAVVV